MAPKNYPKSITIIQPDITEEESAENIKKIQETLVLMAIHYLESKGR